MKNKKKIIFFTESGKGTKGSGHFNRCFYLSLQLNDFNPEIITNKNLKKIPIPINNKIKINIYNNKIKKNLIENYSKLILVIDVYNPKKFLKKFEFLTNFKLIIFNDLNYMKSSKHILINPQKINHLISKNYYNGLNYFPLRKDLTKIKHKIKIRKKVKKIFVFLGSFTNLKNIITIKNYLLKSIDKDIQIHIYSNKEIKNEANIKFYKTHTNYYKLIHNYDLAIISGGFIKFEILYLGIPTLYFTLKQHQTILAKYFSQNSLGVFVSNINNIKNINKKSMNILNNYINSYYLRKNMFNYSRKKIDGKGLENIKKIIKKL